MKGKLGVSGHPPIAIGEPPIIFEQKTGTVHLEITGTGHVGHVIGRGEITGRNSVRSYSIHLGKSKEG